MSQRQHRRLLPLLAAVILGDLLIGGCRPRPPPAPPHLYWLIPDGLRADPDLFTVFRWADEGKLPNLHRMMVAGTSGYSIPDFPSHTPTNFATLLTGVHPAAHGISDGPMHTEGAPLSRPSVGGFSALAKRSPPVWRLLEDAGFRVALLSIPGSTPPELNRGITVRGRWGGWGADTPAVNFEPREALASRGEAAQAFKLFFLGQPLTEFVPVAAAPAAADLPHSFSPGREATLSVYGFTVHALVVDTTDDHTTNYDRVFFRDDAGRTVWSLAPGAWSAWQAVTLSWEGQTFAGSVRARVIKLWPATGQFRIRLFFGNANRFNTTPPEVATRMNAALGPMVDFPDNWPAQLVYEPEDEATFRDEAMDALDWHRRAADWFWRQEKPDVLIQDTYTPNQMLEARWWLRRVDPAHPDYEPEAAGPAWDDLLRMYQGIDAILGAAMAAAPADTIFVLSSDHGIIPVKKQVHLNQLFFDKGWLAMHTDPATGEATIDWAKSRVVYLKMAYVYINPEGLGGSWQRASGPAYEALRREVSAAIGALVDDDGSAPLVRAVPWEQAVAQLLLPADRVGDLVLEARPGYQWWEELSARGATFSSPLVSGYKQAVDARSTPGLWTPFVIMGPGVKAGVRLSQPIAHVDQLPTLLTLLGVPLPAGLPGRVLREALE